MRLKFGIGLAAAILASLAFGVLDGITIKAAPKVGDIHKYRQVAKFDANGTDYEFSSISTRKVVRADPNGSYTVKEEMSEVKFNGADAPDGKGVGDTSVTYSPKGEVLKIEGDSVDENLYQFTNLALFILPGNAVSVGDSWSYDIKENKATGVVPATATYTLVAEDKVDTIDALKIKYSIKETGNGGASSDGTVWLSKADATMLKLAAKWVNAPVATGRTVSGDIAVTLIQ